MHKRLGSTTTGTLGHGYLVMKERVGEKVQKPKCLSRRLVVSSREKVWSAQFEKRELEGRGVRDLGHWRLGGMDVQKLELEGWRS